MSLEGLATVEDMAAIAQQVRAGRIYRPRTGGWSRRMDLEIWTTKDAFWVNTQIAAWGYSIHVLLLAEYLEDSVIKPSDFHNKLDRQNLLEQAGHLLDGELEEYDEF